MTDVIDQAARPATAKPPKARRVRYRLQTASEVCASERIAWAVRDILPASGLFVKYGAPGSGKSFVGLDLAVHLARGAPWLKRRTRQSRVVYIVLEGHIGERLTAYKEFHALDDSELTWISFVNRSPIDLLSDGDVDQLIDDIRAQLGGYSGDLTIIIDTLSRAMPGANENSSEHMGKAIASCGRISDEFGALVGLVHHSGKDAGKGSRGWSGLLGACDAEMVCERDGDRRTLTFTKVKDAQDGLSFDFRLEVVDIGPRSDVDPDAGPDERRTSCVAIIDAEAEPQARQPERATVRGKHQRLLFEALKANGPWSRQTCVDFMAQAGVPRQRRNDTINNLLLTRLIEDTAAGLRVKP